MRISDWSSDVCSSGLGVRDAGGRPGLDYAEQRAALQSGGSHGQIYDAVGADIERELAAGRRVVLSAFSAGAPARLANLLPDHAGLARETLAGCAAHATLPKHRLRLPRPRVEHASPPPHPPPPT